MKEDSFSSHTRLRRNVLIENGREMTLLLACRRNRSQHTGFPREARLLRWIASGYCTSEKRWRGEHRHKNSLGIDSEDERFLAGVFSIHEQAIEHESIFPLCSQRDSKSCKTWKWLRELVLGDGRLGNSPESISQCISCLSAVSHGILSPDLIFVGAWTDHHDFSNLGASSTSKQSGNHCDCSRYTLPRP